MRAICNLIRSTFAWIRSRSLPSFSSKTSLRAFASVMILILSVNGCKLTARDINVNPEEGNAQATQDEKEVQQETFYEGCTEGAREESEKCGARRN